MKRTVKRTVRLLAFVVALVMVLGVNAHALRVSNVITVTFETNATVVHNAAQLTAALASPEATQGTATNPFVILLDGRVGGVYNGAADPDAFAGTQFVIDNDWITIGAYSATAVATIVFDGFGASPLTATNGTAVAGTPTHVVTPMLLIRNATGVVLDGITIEGASNFNQIPSIGIAGIAVDGNSEVDMANVIVRNIVNPGHPNEQSSAGIFVVNSEVNVTDSLIENTSRRGVAFYGTSTGSVVDSEFNANYTLSMDPALGYVPNGVVIWDNSVVTVEDNTFNNFRTGIAAAAAAILYAPTNVSTLNSLATVGANNFNGSQIHFAITDRADGWNIIPIYLLELTGGTPVVGAITVPAGDSITRTAVVARNPVYDNNPSVFSFARQVRVELVSGAVTVNGAPITTVGGYIIIAEDTPFSVANTGSLAAVVDVFVYKP
ncbi:MAG: right-handed parallel beta-helix repeat-containing protein [Oscillospiraceae bacterium]|nr:right-handed parallel beta-helix repeat-containing protein [Oscillospiraceae bacterium]